jgi:hypothetical protein
MENQTRFDLSAAVENWRNELAAQPNLATDDRRELEAHLRDAIAGFQQRGLNDEESFWLARRRVGQPQQLVEEFVKANPNQVWRERIFWMATGIWGFGIFSSIIFPTEGILMCMTPWKLFFWKNSILIFSVQLMAIVAFFAVGRIKLGSSLLLPFQNRLRLTAAFFISIWVACLQLENLTDQMQTRNSSYIEWISNAWNDFLDFKFLIFGLLILLVWLMPPQNQKTPKRV